MAYESDEPDDDQAPPMAKATRNGDAVVAPVAAKDCQRKGWTGLMERIQRML